MDTLSLDEHSSISVAPHLGCNLFSWIDEGVQLLYSPEGFPDGEQHLAGGNPILFPAVGRTWNRSVSPPVAGEYSIHGLAGTYHMPTHGIADMGEWSAVGERRGSESVTAEYKFEPAAAVLESHYPFPVALSVRYTLRRGSLEIRVTMRNDSGTPAPAALGFHPYFTVSDKRAVSIMVPCTHRIVLDEELVVPTGETRTRRSDSIELDPAESYDMAFGGVNGTRATIRRAHPDRDVHIDADEHIESYVVYSGSNPSFVCLEPWTRGLGAFSQLSLPGWEQTEEIAVLAAGETRTVTLSYRAENTEP